MARRIRFIRNFDYRVKPTVTIAYKAGQELLVPDGAAAAALKAGAAEATDQPTEQADHAEQR